MKNSYTKKYSLKHGLYIVSTPIGNLEDITLRAIRVLKNSDLILCEDTRHSIKLFNHYNIKKPLLSYHKFNENKATEKIINLIKSEKIVSLVSDAGTPTISDPGNILINKCVENKINIFPVPGSSSLTSAMSISGFNEKFIFLGFLPKKINEIRKMFNSISNLNCSLVFFTTPQKIKKSIELMKEFFFNRKICIAKEMTKIHESFIRGNVSNFDEFSEIKGELTVILSEIIEKKGYKREIPDSIKLDIIRMLDKYSHKDVVEFFSKKENLPKKIIYKFCLQNKKK